GRRPPRPAEPGAGLEEGGVGECRERAEQERPAQVRRLDPERPLDERVPEAEREQRGVEPLDGDERPPPRRGDRPAAPARAVVERSGEREAEREPERVAQPERRTGEPAPPQENPH